MDGTFHERIDDLIELVGDGTLHGEVTVDQIYAKFQHERVDLKHPRGGQAHYLGEPLLQYAYKYMQNLADGLLQGQIRGAMIQNMEDLSQKVFERAPREFNDLRNSGHPVVSDESHIIYNRMPVKPRLTEAQLRAKGKLRDAFGGRN